MLTRYEFTSCRCSSCVTSVRELPEALGGHRRLSSSTLRAICCRSGRGAWVFVLTPLIVSRNSFLSAACTAGRMHFTRGAGCLQNPLTMLPAALGNCPAQHADVSDCRLSSAPRSVRLPA